MMSLFINGFAWQVFREDKNRALYVYNLRQEIDKSKDKPDGYKLWVQIRDPKGFRTTFNSVQSNRNLIESIPVNEDYSNWSEIVTFIFTPQIHRQASYLVSYLKGSLTQSLESSNNKIIFGNFSPKLEIVNQKLVPKNLFKRESFHAKYDYLKGNEFIAVMYLSGPEDALSIQYTMKLTKTLTEEKAKEKAREFFKNNVLLYIQ
ncbi:MAG TPA: hypothetical protein QF353_01650 [Gammaproteobacteria bacterium]|nr:hypothetical protein [Gammaproteobacteria bacterium]